MRGPLRKWLEGGFVASWTAAAALVACGGGDTGRDGRRDAGDDGAAFASEVIVSDLIVYVGSLAAIDAAQTRGVDYQWTVKTVPAGSAVSTASLGGSTSARASFVPDVAGEYVLEVSAVARGARGTKSVTVTAAPAPIFFLRARLADGGGYLEYRSTGNDRSHDIPITCPTQTSVSSSPAEFVQRASSLADVALDWWEAPAGRPSRVAFASAQLSADGGRENLLALGSSDTSCANPPLILHHLQGGGDPEDPLLQPRYSPDGARVAFIDKLASGYTVESVGHDGADRRRLGRFCPDGVDNCAGHAAIPARPQWFDMHTVGWPRDRQDDAGASWEVVLANDSATSNVRVHMICPGFAPRSIAFLRDGAIVANPLIVASSTDLGIADLVVYRPSKPGGICQVVRNLTNLPNSGSYAREFSVSPDESEIAFVRRGTLAGEPAPDAGDPYYGGVLYTVSTNGGQAIPFGGAGEFALYGPRYVASASQLAWNGVVPGGASGSTPNLVDGGVPAMKLGSRGGNDIRPLAVSDLDSGVYVLGGGNGSSGESGGCSFARGTVSSGGMLVAIAASSILVARRRRSGERPPRASSR